MFIVDVKSELLWILVKVGSFGQFLFASLLCVVTHGMTTWLVQIASIFLYQWFYEILKYTDKSI